MQVLVSILEAGGEMPGNLLEGLLVYLVPPDSKEHSEACRYAASVPKPAAQSFKHCSLPKQPMFAADAGKTEPI